MDPLDPLTEIIKSGQSFSYAIALERILWLMIGFFFLGAISTSIVKSMRRNDWFGNKSFLAGLEATKKKEKFSQKVSKED